jgi:hypothetical protein
MARIRSIRPEFFTSEQIMELGPLTRLLFIGMWSFCDDHGVHPASIKSIKAEIFPSDDISITEVQSMIDELISQRLVVEYSSNDRSYWHVTGWEKHQKVEKPNFKHPYPYKQNQIVIKDSSNSRRMVVEQSDTDKGLGIVVGIGEKIKTQQQHAGAREQLIETVEDHRKDLLRLFPEIDIPVAVEKLLHRFRDSERLLDPWMTALKWFQREFKPQTAVASRSSPIKSKGVLREEQAREILAANAAACRDFCQEGSDYAGQ